MAVVSPTGLVGARSPIYISWDGSGTTEVTRFQLEIYAWTGDKSTRPASPIYTIDRSVFVDIYPTANIAPLLRDLFSPLIGKWTQSQELDYSPDSFLWVEVDYDIDYNTSSNVTGTTDTFLVSNSYATRLEGTNKEISTGILWNGTERYLDKNDTQMLPVYLGTEIGEGLDIVYGYEDRVIADGGTIESLQCANIGLRFIRIWNDDGTNYRIPVDENFMSNTDAQDRVVLFPCGPANLSNWKVAEGRSGTAPYDTEYYDVQLLNGLDEVIDERRIYNVCEPKYDPQQFFFVNKLGVWDSITFFKRSDEDLSITKSMYKPSVGSGGSTGYRVGTAEADKRTYNYTNKKKLTFNTGFIDESFNEVIEEFMMSETILMVINRDMTRSGTTYSISQSYRWANLNTQDVRLQKHINDKTINYTMEIEVDDLANSLVI